MTIANKFARRLYLLLAAVGLILGVGVAQAQTVIYQHTDALGSPVAVTDQNKVVIERTEYEPFGKVINHPLKDGPGYTGHVADAATGMNYMQQRYYDSQLGVFISTDPKPVDTTTAYNFCRYCYARQNPYRFTDPDGRDGTETFAETAAWGDVNYANSRTMTADDSVRGLIVMRDIFLSQFGDAPGASIASAPVTLGKAAQLAQNAKQGAQAEMAVAKQLGEQVAGKRVTLEASTGQRSVADIVKKDGGVVEVKTGKSPLSPGQKAVKADIEAGRSVTPRGANAAKAGLTPNQPTPMKCYDVTRC